MAGGPQETGREAAGAGAAPGQDGPGYGLVGFLAMSFAVVGLTGLLAAHIAPLPVERVLAREAVLDEAVAAVRTGQLGALEAMRPRLADSAAAVLPPGSAAGSTIVGADFEAKVAAERVAMRARMLAEAAATGTRLRWMIVVVTLLAGAFGVGMMLAGMRGGRRRGDGKG